jgi:hypothetical protein
MVMRKQLAQTPVALLPNLELKLRQSGLAATVVAPIWTGKVWHHALTEMAVEELTIRDWIAIFLLGSDP